MRSHRSLAQRGAAVIAAGLLGLGAAACGDMMDEFDQPPLEGDMDPGFDDGFDDDLDPTEDPLDE